MLPSKWLPPLQDPNSHTSRPTAEGCNSPDEGYPVSDLHHACPHNGTIDNPPHCACLCYSAGHLAHADDFSCNAWSTAMSSRPNSELSSGRATKLTAPNGLPGQITLVRSPNGIKAGAAQLTELQQQHFQRQQQQQLPMVQQQHEQLPAQQQQHSNKGQRSHRVRKANVPAVANVIAESDVARLVQNAVDVSHNKDSNVPPRAQEAAGTS